MMLPTGTVTFLFTDIEGSTRLWEAQPDGMRLALEQHDSIPRAAIETNNGHVFKTIGDAFCAAFPTVTDAVDAALAVQQSLGWSSPSEDDSSHHGEPHIHSALRVRMAVHTGSAQERDGDYFGPPLNRVARLLSAAHGGQILLSATAWELAHEDLPSGASAKDLGVLRFRGIQWSERIFQLCHPRLRSEFPPLLSRESVPHNLPEQVTSFVGRVQERLALREMLERSRLLTLTGAGGTGKTRLALQISRDIMEQFADGVWFVELASITEASRALHTAAAVLSVQENPGQLLLETLIYELKDRKLLLVLDNCEHLLTACAALAGSLLRGCSLLQVLATSRETLGIPGEQGFRVPSLTLPPLEAALPGRTTAAGGAEALTQYDAVRLLIDRAVLRDPGFAITDQNAPAVARICRQLDGIPLAIELAAVRFRGLSVDQIASRMDHRFRLLTGGSRTALPRQQTLRAMVDWSYDLLDERERCLLRRLSVFSGGWSLEAAEAVCSGQPEEVGGTAGQSIEEWEALDVLTSLVEKSLVDHNSGESRGRYQMLETMREYAKERMEESGETERLRHRHAAYYLELAEQAGGAASSEEEMRGVKRLEAEQSNLRTALAWLLDREPIAALRLAMVLKPLWFRVSTREGCDFIETALQRAEAAPPELRGRALIAAHYLANHFADSDRAAKLAQESVRMFEECGNRTELANALLSWALKWTVGTSGLDRTSELEHLERSLALFRQEGDLDGAAHSLQAIGNHFAWWGDLSQALPYYEESLNAFRLVGNERGLGYELYEVGQAISHVEGPTIQARVIFEESLAVLRRSGGNEYYVIPLHWLGWIALEQGDLDSAQSHFEDLLDYTREENVNRHIPMAWGSLSDLSLARGEYAAAQAFSQAALDVHLKTGHLWGIPWELYKQGRAALGLGKIVEARSLLRDCAHRFNSYDSGGVSLPDVWHAMGDVESAAGDYNAARRFYRECLHKIREGGLEKYNHRRDFARCLRSLAALAGMESDWMDAAKLAGAADSVQRGLGVEMAPVVRQDWERVVASIQTGLDAAAFAAA